MAVRCCLPVSTALQDHVPVSFRKNLCHLLVTSHLSILHIISVAISTFMLMFQLAMVINFITFLDSCDLKQLVNKPTHLHGHMLDLILSPCDQDTIADVKICDFVSDHALVKSTICLPSSVGSHPK